LTLEAGEALSKPGRAELPYPLTPREVEVLDLLALRKTKREIVQDFVISVGTVKNHVEHLTRKLEVSDRTQAVVQALEIGITSLLTGRDLRLLPAAPTGSTLGM
jgi:DNA-binding NarL/FixJ family response regulator